jgi:hypothetical protein
MEIINHHDPIFMGSEVLDPFFSLNFALCLCFFFFHCSCFLHERYVVDS